MHQQRNQQADYYINFPPLQRSGSSFCLPFPCVYITSLGGDMHSRKHLLVHYVFVSTHALRCCFGNKKVAGGQYY